MGPKYSSTVRRSIKCNFEPPRIFDLKDDVSSKLFMTACAMLEVQVSAVLDKISA